MSSLLYKICRLSKQAILLLRPSKGLFTFMIFLVLSSLFWLSTTLNEYYDYEIPVPVTIDGVPKNIVFTETPTDTVRVMVRDKGFSFLQYLYGDKIRPISVNFSKFSKSHKCVVSQTELHRLVSRRLYGSSTISSIKPERLEFSFAKGYAKHVPIRLIGQIIPAPNHYLAHTQMFPQKVTVFASKERLDSIKFVTTENLNIVNFTDTVRRNVKINPIKGTRIYPDIVTVGLYPDILTEETVEVPIIAVNVPENITLRTFPAKVAVRFTVGVSQYRTINTSQFRVEVDYNDIVPGSDKCQIQIARMPLGVMKANTELQKVDYLIEN